MDNPKHDKRFYFEDGTAILQCNTSSPPILFNVYEGPLTAKCKFFKGMFKLPEKGSQVTEREGKTDTNPIHLGNNIEYNDFVALCYFLYDPLAAPNTMEYLLSLIKLSHFYEIESATAYAVPRLEVFLVSDPIRQMNLAWVYSIHDWIAPAFSGLLEMKQEDHTFGTQKEIGEYPFWVLTNTRGRIQSLEQTMCFFPTKLVIGRRCPTPQSCEVAWKGLWWSEFAVSILFPNDDPSLGRVRLSMPLAVERIRSVLESRPIRPGDLCDVCRGPTIDNALASLPMKRMRNFKKAGIKKIRRWMVAQDAGGGFAENSEDEEDSEKSEDEDAMNTAA
ncbi:hypothetical protein C8J56DRAFT_1167022 [Mycena floridula]|nr:hypothetical protein C8J56DRAFT_1167022 [Mycena floridula]